ncbi:MAG: glycosyl transferase family 1 [Bacteroidetes bacterium]|nr:glycosyl transferase family 1 [Bacteroidota bacterium]
MKKVLIITYYWPPSGGIGVQRCLKFAKYLRDFGWEPIIYAPENAQYVYFDESNLKEIPENITILKCSIREPFNLFKKFSGRKKDDAFNPISARDKKVKFIDNFAIWIRGNFFIPDARFLWIKPSVKYLSKYIQKNHVDAILTDGPPHTNTVIGCRLSQKFNIPWLADFQDPWTQVDYYKFFKLTKRADQKHHKLEQEVFKTAKKITIASPSWKKDIEKIGAKNVDVVLWGYDEDDYKSFKNQKLDKKFTIAHTGILGFDRNPDVLFEALKDIKNEIPQFADDLKINLAGMVDYSVIESIKENELEKNTNLFGTINRHEAINLVMKAQLLLLPINKAENALGRIPAKLFEYLCSKRPILYLGPLNGDVANIINYTSSGKCFEYDNYEDIKDFVKYRYKKYKDDEIDNCTFDISEYSVKKQTGKIASYLDEMTKV